MSAVILNVGARGSGKTTKNRRMLEQTHPGARLVLDVNGEYTDLFPRDPIPYDQFTKMLGKVKSAVILIEEATVYLSTRGRDANVIDILVRARHSKNVIILVFHSLQDVPTYIYRLANKLILHKTLDNEDDIYKRFGDSVLVEKFKELKALPSIPVPNQPGKFYSPSIVHKLM